MQETTMLPLTAWGSFYVIIGSAAAALTGLQFVVITLIAGTRVRRTYDTVSAFGTPTVVHFCVALLISVILSAPWRAFWHVSIMLGLCGLWGIGYGAVILRRARHQTDYQPVLEDWLWHIIFPLVAYCVLLVAAIVLPFNPVLTLFGIGAVTVLLVFIGIHNAWDTITYIVVEDNQSNDKG